MLYRKPPNISPGLIFVRKHFLVGLYMGGLYTGVLIHGQDVSNINNLLTFRDAPISAYRYIGPKITISVSVLL